MRTKTLLLTAIATGVAASAMAADPVYSQNVVGFVNTTLKSGYNLVCPPLKATNDTVAAIFPTVPDGTTVARWDGANQTFLSAATYDSIIFAGWDDPTMLITAGEAVFIFVGADTTLTFVGEVRQGALSTPLVGGYSLVGSQVPQNGGITTVLGFTPSDGTTCASWDAANQTYLSAFTYDSIIFGGWDQEPVLGISEGVFIFSGGPGQWTRTFNVQ